MSYQSRSREHEERLAAHYKGRRLPQSGAQKWSRWDQRKTQDGDVVTAQFLMEHKYTIRKSISLKKSWLNKVSNGARALMKKPLMILTFEEDGQPLEDWVVLPRAYFDQLLAGVHDNE